MKVLFSQWVLNMTLRKSQQDSLLAGTLAMFPLGLVYSQHSARDIA